MGIFHLPQDDTLEAKLEAVKGNIELYKTHKSLYLLESFAVHILEQAIEQAKYESTVEAKASEGDGE